MGVAPFSNKTSVKTPSCCRIPQRTCQDLGDPGKLSSQDIATGIQQHGIHTHMQTQNLCDKNWWKNGNQTSAPVSLKNSYSSTKIWIWKLLLDFILGHSPKLYIQSIQQGYDLHAACQQTRGRYAQCAIVKSLTGKNTAACWPLGQSDYAPPSGTSWRWLPHRSPQQRFERLGGDS